MRRKIIAAATAAFLTAQLLTGCAAAPPVSAARADGIRTAETDGVRADGVQAARGPVVTDDPDQYVNNEVLALYGDGTVEVYPFETKEALEAGIRALAADEAVSVIQPNYVYEKQGLPVNDALIGEQWALYNDGTFTIEEEKNRYPVFDDPFGKPADPGEWDGPEYDGGPGWYRSDLVGVLVQVAKTKSTAGVDIRVSDAWGRYGNGNREAVVALIDTGINYGHEDLAGAVWVNSDEIPDNGVDDDGNGYVDDVHGWNFYGNNNQVFSGSDDSHGTHGAGTIAAAGNNGVGISGIVPGDRVKVMAVKVLGGSEGGGNTASLIRAIRYAEDNGAVICNLSLASTSDDRAMYQAIANSGMLFVAAAGNGSEETGLGLNTDETPIYPAAYDLDNIISVANISCDGLLHESSNYGAASVDLAAPGSYILSTTADGSYGYMTGTSMAAPMVSAVAAMTYSYFDGITPAQVKEILLNTARPMDSLNGRVATGGMLDAGAALAYDISGLSGAGFTNAGAAGEAGTAPLIQIQHSQKMGSSYLTVRVVDIDGDLETLRYAKGEVSAGEFAAGAGAVFKINAQDRAKFQIGGPGTYSFYAKDKKGNETVESIRLTLESDGPGA